MAADLVKRFQLGQRDVVDFLGVSFPAVDKVGHDFGPDSHELQDTIMRLDATLGTLLDGLDATVGRDGYALALSADHGVAPVPEGRRAAGQPAGRVPLATAAAAVEQALVTAGLGPGPHVARIEYTELYLTDAARAKVTAEHRGAGRGRTARAARRADGRLDTGPRHARRVRLEFQGHPRRLRPRPQRRLHAGAGAVLDLRAGPEPERRQRHDPRLRQRLRSARPARLLRCAVHTRPECRRRHAGRRRPDARPRPSGSPSTASRAGRCRRPREGRR